MDDRQWDSFLNDLARSINLTEQSKRILLSFPKHRQQTTSSKSLNDFVWKTYKEIFGDITDKNYALIKNLFFKALAEANFISFKNNPGKGKLEHVRDELNRQFEQRIGNQLTRVAIHQKFPIDLFKSQIALNLKSSDRIDNHKFGNSINILQTYAPNLDRLVEPIVESLIGNIEVRILLVWPKSQAAKIRSEALSRYANLDAAFDIEHQILMNLETISTKIFNHKDIGDGDRHLKVRLYDSNPSISIYRVNSCLLQGYFMHQNLAVNST